MVATPFIRTGTFAVVAVFVGAFQSAYAAPVPTDAAVSESPILRRFCWQLSCLYAAPSEDTSGLSDGVSAEASSSALQVINLLISALQSAGDSIQKSSSAQATNTTVDAVTPATVDKLATAVEAVAEAATVEVSAPTTE
ncbi:hypothetical protein C2E23DRAFT_882705 [Lenzites betulinus]|nr:hypothetical protein C2E23DRAFT_882705 [Lenzites betulinus]